MFLQFPPQSRVHLRLQPRPWPRPLLPGVSVDEGPGEQIQQQLQQIQQQLQHPANHKNREESETLRPLRILSASSQIQSQRQISEILTTTTTTVGIIDYREQCR